MFKVGDKVIGINNSSETYGKLYIITSIGATTLEVSEFGKKIHKVNYYTYKFRKATKLDKVLK